MEAICSSETSVETRRTTRRHIPEDDTLHLFEDPLHNEHTFTERTIDGKVDPVLN
jgi:hypothetical protein